MQLIKNFLKKLIPKSNNEEGYMKLLDCDIKLDSIVYNKIESKYENITQIYNILNDIMDYEDKGKTITLTTVGNNEMKYYFIFEFMSDISQEKFKILLTNLSLSKEKLNLYKNMKGVNPSINVRRIEPHIINIEMTIKQIYNYLKS